VNSRKPAPTPAPGNAPAPARRFLAPAALAVASVIIAGVGSLAVVAIFAKVDFPAFTTSNVLRAITVIAQVVALALVVAGAWIARRGETGHGIGKLGPAPSTRVGKLLLPAANALLVAVTLAIPLSASKLYLMGASVDQEFRSQFLERSTTSLGVPDMAYADLPSFYPSGWFWLGGRFANALGMDGWEAFKPWAIVSLAMTAALATVLWTRLLRTDVGAAAATATTLVMLAHGAHEPYGAVVALLAPPVLLLAWHALAPTGADPRRAGKIALAATLAFLGISACFYTLYTGWAALTVVLMALVAAAVAKWGRGADGGTAFRFGPGLPIARLLVIGIGACIVALLAWAPYLIKTLTGTLSASGLANHYLPPEGAQFPLPMFDADPGGLLCLAGLVWLALRATSSRRAQALGIGVLGAYAWVGLSLLGALAGTTLLGFRMDLVISLLLSAAGVFGAFELAAALRRVRLPERAAGKADSADAASAAGTSNTTNYPALRPVAALAAVAALGAVAYAQHIPTVLDEQITHAYEDTDGNGERADRHAPDDARYYPEITSTIENRLHRAPEDTVVASGAPAFFSFHPFLAYQAITSHYANPLGDYAARAAVIESWAEASDGADLYSKITAPQWRAPDAIVAERLTEKEAKKANAADPENAEAHAGDYTIRLAKDLYPSDPNVEFYDVRIPAEVVEGAHFDTKDVGPFTVIFVQP